MHDVIVGQGLEQRPDVVHRGHERADVSNSLKQSEKDRQLRINRQEPHRQGGDRSQALVQPQGLDSLAAENVE